LSERDVGRRLCGYSVSLLHQYLDNLILWIESVAREMREGRATSDIVRIWVEETEGMFDIAEGMSSLVSDTCPGYRSGEFLEGLRKARDEVRKGFERGPDDLFKSVYHVRLARDGWLPKALRR
jgi:hypothetical protein